MKTIFLDFETYYDSEYTLRKMTPVEYCLDPRFDCLGCAVKLSVDEPGFWLDGDKLPEFFLSLDPTVTSLVTFNALFDLCIVAWRYNFIPRLMICTMSVARACLGHRLKALSLNSVAMHLGLGAKGGAGAKVKGMDLAAIHFAGLYDEFVAYALDDNEKNAAIYKKLVLGGVFPVSELAIMDTVLRCAIQPAFRLDAQLLAAHLEETRADKEALLVHAGVDVDDLMSNQRFAELLRGVGVDPPMKISITTGLETYAFAKSDPQFMELEEHDDPSVQALMAARLGHKSTIEETRTERLIAISEVTWPGNHEPLMPVPLRYSGAHTHRLSGDWKLNLQNFRRGGTLRRALIAPPGHQVLSVDASQIEARIVAWICGQDDLVEAFARGEDVYSSFASDVFDKPVNKKDNPQERFVGKTAILGLGYGLGDSKFLTQVKTLSKQQTGTTIELSIEDAIRVVQTYRTKYPRIPATWRKLNYSGIPVLVWGGGFTFGPCVFERGSIFLPSGLKLFYYDLQQVDGEWLFTYGGKPKRLYGGALLENIVQALARIIVMDAAIRIRKRIHPLRLALQVHDELVYIVPNALVGPVRAIVLEEMARRPVWAPTLPLASEAGTGLNYGDAK